MSNEAQLDTPERAMTRDAVAATREPRVALTDRTQADATANALARAVPTQARVQGSRPITTSWLALSGPRLPARSIHSERPRGEWPRGEWPRGEWPRGEWPRGERPRGERMTMSMLPWISPASERAVEDVVPARMTMTRQVQTERTTIGRQR